MKTSLDIDDNLYLKVKAIADARGTTFRALVEAGLQFLLRGEAEKQAPFRLPAAHFDGPPGFAEDAGDRSVSTAIAELNEAGAGQRAPD